jgi:cobalt-zinc-cadmium efflux system protein
MSRAHAHPPQSGGMAQPRDRERRALAATLVLLAAFAVVEVIGGLLTDSLALLADAGHMLSDVLAIALALGAIWLAQRPSTTRTTFGYKRAEILAALINGITLVAISALILFEAYRRLDDPPGVLGGWMLVVACTGLAVNGISALILHRGGGDSLNVSAAMRHVLADLLGSIGVIVAAVVILTTGWRYIDPLVSAAIALLILASSLPILRDSLRVLLEASPAGIDVAEVGNRIASMEGVKQVHDLHVWTITSGFPALSAHVMVGADEDCHARRRHVEAMLREEFGIDHSTLQVEHLAPPELIQIERPR